MPGMKTKGGAILLLVILFVVFTLSLTMLALDWERRAAVNKGFSEMAALARPPRGASEPSQGPPAQVSESPALLEEYRELHQRFPDLVGWIRIAGTAIDYPVMFSGDDFYLDHGVDGKKSRSGVPYLDKRCQTEPFGANTIIYGHHMKDGTMFAGLEKYRDQQYYREHRVICFDTLFAKQEYVIFAVFQSKVYASEDAVFKHYNFLQARDQEEFDDYLTAVRGLSLYDTGLVPAYGDELLTLVTCSYHTKRGQLVVVAKKSGGD